MKDEQVRELLYQSLETELGGVQVYTTALRCAENDDLKEEWEKYLEQTKNHVTIMEDVLTKLDLDPDEETPGRKVVRNIGEAQRAKDLGGTLVWVDADSRMRYERIQAADRGRSGEDNKTYEEFLQEEQDEMHPADPNDPSLLNGAGVKALADVTILNESDTESLKQAIEAVISF